MLEEKVSVSTTTTAKLGWYGKPKLLHLPAVGLTQVLIFLRDFLIHNCTQIVRMLCSVADKMKNEENAQEMEKLPSPLWFPLISFFFFSSGD